MTFNKLFAIGLCLSMGLGISAQGFADDPPTQGQITDPNFKGTVNMDTIDQDAPNFVDRVNNDLVNRPAPQVNQTRAAIEAIYGPAQTDLAPNKDYEVYTNEFDLVDGKLFRRQIKTDSLRIYEVTYCAGPHKSTNDRATDVKLRVIPRVGDHINLVQKMLGRPLDRVSTHDQQHVVYGIPKQRWVFYNDVISTPQTAINAYYNADGYLVGEEFVPLAWRGSYALTSAGRYTEIQTRFEPDTKVGY
jgi:hypothetical protein